MKFFLSLVFISIFGWLGWMLGDLVGTMTAYFVSGLFSIVGFVVGHKVHKMLTE